MGFFPTDFGKTWNQSLSLCPMFFFCWIFFSSFGTQRVLGFHYGFPKNDRRGAIFSPFFFSLPGLWSYGGRSLRPVWFGLCYLSHRRKLHGMCHGEFFFLGGEYFDTWTSNSSVLWLVLCVFCVLSNEHVKTKNVLHPPPRKKFQHFTKQTTETHPTIKPPGGREGFVLDLEQETCLACADRCLNCTSSGPSRCDAHGCNKA